MTAARSITDEAFATSCYFRTTVNSPHRKALVQINEDCNLRCAHCFVSATRVGKQMPLTEIVGKVVPQLSEARVQRVTLTGGEPTIHPDFMAVVHAFRQAGMDVGICTNATTLNDQQITELAGLGVHCNVSLDGFAADSHGKFRGDRDSFDLTVATVKKLGAAGILQGLLCTPNSLAQNEEYVELCQFARENGARYVLLNPLGSMGRGVKSQSRLAKTTLHMQEIHTLTAPFDGPDLDIAHIRFPNSAGKPLSGCEAGTIIYVFTPGEVTVCPYLVFAARTPASQHADSEFIVGNIFTDPDIAQRLDGYRFHDRYHVGANSTCDSCSMNAGCGKGCPAAVVAAGGRVGDVDAEQCPTITSNEVVGERRLLPLMPV
ncbi:radical SAM additional 4Fe4S-binding SPASM domain-containing protein [Lentzea xinjiangensis]|uniref:Radical SAM additional 4Fe4S-binding SPASM domain-containing protein n=1 Tax=Lentzea xinjiangensis TaxID=402600 RepID=A0A1H9RYG3_9PSEU|nr:radical SAM protein [Lentzea xinjiangensis]SER77791.1 radical SAM additional 4Fe4S-binding SPASM domain-containing protein [Lentzea xinjiangensis]